ncbi:MAG: hypothetical protein ABUS57_01685 [Pseudomonadota bacterium]
MRARAEQIIALADALRRHARNCGADLNAANLFVHAVLMRALAARIDFDHLDEPDADWDGALAEFEAGGLGALAETVELRRAI